MRHDQRLRSRQSAKPVNAPQGRLRRRYAVAAQALTAVADLDREIALRRETYKGSTPSLASNESGQATGPQSGPLRLKVSGRRFANSVAVAFTRSRNTFGARPRTPAPSSPTCGNQATVRGR
jgi:hypothetical protein